MITFFLKFNDAFGTKHFVCLFRKENGKADLQFSISYCIEPTHSV